jgi:hypothetical protein
MLMRVAVALTMAGVPAGVVAQSAMVDGIVGRRGCGNKKFDMEDGMTMVFQAKDPAMLEQVKIGDKIRFEPERVNGKFTVMKIEKKK